MLHGPIANDVDDSEEKPAKEVISLVNKFTCMSTYPAPDNAQPECMPPTCWRNDVAASLMRTGAHWKVLS